MNPLSISESKAPLSVGVFVDLYRSADAGGHVKCWERLAEAAAGEDLDLTVYFLGDRANREEVAPNVRRISLPAAFGTKNFRFLQDGPGQTDLAPFQPRLLKHLSRHHLLHTTDAHFAMARTARFWSRWKHRALVHSMHSDAAGYTRVYSEQSLRRLFGNGRLSRLLVERWGLPDRFTRSKERELAKHLRRCTWVLLGPADEGSAPTTAGRSSVLRRGIDKNLFHPGKRNRARLEREMGIGADRLVLLYAGRLSPGKEVMTLARVARILADRGLPVHALFVGDGPQKEEIRQLLGPDVSLPGVTGQEELAWLYASADLFVLPSRIEVAPNVVLEAQASGLPAVVSAAGGARKMLVLPDAERMVIESCDSFEWAQALELLLHDSAMRAGLGRQARQAIEAKWPGWREVFQQDLLPVWRQVAQESAQMR